MDNANDLFKDYTGTYYYYKHLFGMTYTDGIAAMCEEFQCYWLLDLICSYQHCLKDKEFQAWTLGVNEDRTAIVICTDGDNNILQTQDIPFTDFKAKEATIWVEESIILLPSEH